MIIYDKSQYEFSNIIRYHIYIFYQEYVYATLYLIFEKEFEGRREAREMGFQIGARRVWKKNLKGITRAERWDPELTRGR